MAILSKDTKVVIFSIGNEEYAAEIDKVERILEFEKITRIPESPAYLKGVINYQGSILPIIDLKERFNLHETDIKENSKIIIAKEEEGSIGFIIDNVSQVMDLDYKSISPPPEMIAGILKEYIKGIVKLDKRIIILLNLSRVLDFNERKEIREKIR